MAHGLRKDMSEPYQPWGEISDLMREDGSHPLWDRDEVHEIYADWRRIFNSYDPPRYAVAEAIVHPSRRARSPRPTVSGMRSTSRCWTSIGGPTTIAA